jgi:magnesium-protoporphyrin O-methyltransferase
MSSSTVDTARREALTTYFDRTAAEAWKVLTTDSPVSRIRATVRAGRDQMRAGLLAWLPRDLSGRTVLDAGCGTGALSIEAARAGAAVTAIDVAGSLVAEAQNRLPGDVRLLGAADGAASGIAFHVGDMHSAAFGTFDHVVAMDSLIHYEAADILTMIAGFAARTRYSVVFTVAPQSPALSVMHAVGKLFPRKDRAPAIVPIRIERLAKMIAADSRFSGWKLARSARVSSGFYTSHALELVTA